jgi:hypothetical protein
MASNEPRMSSGATATNTRTVGGSVSMTAGLQARDATSRRKRHRRTPAAHRQHAVRTERCQLFARQVAPPEPARPARGVQCPGQRAAAAPTRRDARYSSSTRAVTARRLRGHAPTLQGSALRAEPPAGTTEPRARPRSSVRPPIATSVLRSSLNPASPGVIPPSLMGHATADFNTR